MIFFHALYSIWPDFLILIAASTNLLYGWKFASSTNGSGQDLHEHVDELAPPGDGQSLPAGARDVDYWAVLANTKTAYRNAPPAQANILRGPNDVQSSRVATGDEWTLAAVDVVVRHGTRMPKQKDFHKWTETQARVAERLRPIDACRTGSWETAGILSNNGSSSEEDTRALLESTGLVAAGARELADLGRRWRTRVANAFTKEDVIEKAVRDHHALFETSSRLRAVASAEAFVAGFFEGAGTSAGGGGGTNIVRNDFRLRFFDRCAKKGKRKTTESGTHSELERASYPTLDEKKKGEPDDCAQKRVAYLGRVEAALQRARGAGSASANGEHRGASSRFVVDSSPCLDLLTAMEAWQLYNLAAFELAIVGRSEMGSALFGASGGVSEVVLKLESAADRQHWYRSGGGNAAFAAPGNPFAAEFLRDWVQRIANVVELRDNALSHRGGGAAVHNLPGGEVELEAARPPVLRFGFGHAETVLPMLYWLGLYERHRDPTSALAPFGANLALLVWAQSSGDDRAGGKRQTFVEVLLNENVVLEWKSAEEALAYLGKRMDVFSTGRGGGVEDAGKVGKVVEQPTFLGRSRSVSIGTSSSNSAVPEQRGESMSDSEGEL
eukprot:g1916.t1